MTDAWRERALTVSFFRATNVPNRRGPAWYALLFSFYSFQQGVSRAVPRCDSKTWDCNVRLGFLSFLSTFSPCYSISLHPSASWTTKAQSRRRSMRVEIVFADSKRSRTSEDVCAWGHDRSINHVNQLPSTIRQLLLLTHLLFFSLKRREIGFAYTPLLCLALWSQSCRNLSSSWRFELDAIAGKIYPTYRYKCTSLISYDYSSLF